MTGYTPHIKAFVTSETGVLIPYSDFQPVVYIVHDGSRVNLTDDYVVTRSVVGTRLLLPSLCLQNRITAALTMIIREQRPAAK